MRLDTPLDDIFSTASHVKMLRALFALPSEMGRSGRDLARRAGVSHPRASQVLAELADQGIVAVHRLPRTALYRVNRAHVLAETLRRLFELEPKWKFDLLSLVAAEIRSRGLPVREARIFGSAARGSMASESDVDLALVTSRDSVEIVRAGAERIAEKARNRFGTRIHVLVGSPSLESLTSSRQAKRAVWQAIEREGIDVLAGGKSRN